MFAAASAVLFFAILLRLTQRRIVALAFSCLYLFENAFIAHLSAAHLDAFLVFFALGAVLCAILRMQSPLSPNRWVITLFGVCIGLAAMVKVSGLLLAVLALWMIRKPASTEGPGGLTGSWRLDLGAASRILFGMLSVMVMVMTAHALLSHQPPDPMSSAGRKDLRFISQTHLDYLRGNAELTPTVLVHVTADYVRFIHAEHEGIPQGGPGTSRALFDPETFITRRIDNAAFSYLREAKLEDNQFTVAFTLQTKVDQVPPEDATGVFRDMRRMDKFAEITVPVP
jgi:hypothetical protein